MSTADITPDNVPERRGVFTPELLDRCISCGFCLPACPTYELTGVETSSPRGRINLMRALETGVLADDDPTVLDEASFCLGCRACEPVCPAGVQYGALLEEWRDHLWNGRRRPWKVRPLMWAVDSPRRVRAIGIVRRHAGRRRDAPGPVNLMLGCFERVLYPRVSRAARELVPELAAPAGQGCCGALHAHNGALERGNEMAEELGEALPGTIVTTAGGCAAHLASVLGRERVKELSQWLVETRAPAEPRRRPGRRPPADRAAGLLPPPQRAGRLARAARADRARRRVRRAAERSRLLRRGRLLRDRAPRRQRARARPPSRRDRRRRPRHHRGRQPGLLPAAPTGRQAPRAAERASSTSPSCWPASNDAPTPAGTVVLHTGVGILADVGAGAAWWAV